MQVKVERKETMTFLHVIQIEGEKHPLGGEKKNPKNLRKKC